MIITNTPSVEGHQIAGYTGIAVGEAVLGAHVFHDTFAGIMHIAGCRAGGYEAEQGKAHNLAREQSPPRAARLGAYAAVGGDADYTPVNNALMARASGATLVLA